MTQRNSAARRFADGHATYHVDSNDYVLRPQFSLSYSEVDIEALTARVDAARNRLRQHEIEADRERVEHAALLTTVMRLLGVEGQYADTTDTAHTYSGIPYERVTKTAVSKFADDLRAAQGAVEGEAALKRLRKAVKSTQKESSK